jgi:hypothetical protein
MGLDCKLKDPAASLSGQESSAATLENWTGLHGAVELTNFLPYQESKVGLVHLTSPLFEGVFLVNSTAVWKKKLFTECVINLCEELDHLD